MLFVLVTFFPHVIMRHVTIILLPLNAIICNCHHIFVLCCLCVFFVDLLRAALEEATGNPVNSDVEMNHCD